MAEARLAHRGPLAWDALLGYHAVRAIPGVERVTPRAYLRTVEVGGVSAVLELASAEESALALRLCGVPLDDAVAMRARRLAGLDAPLAAAQRVLGADPLLAPLLAALPGLRPAGTWDPFELGVRAILGQQVSVAGASTLTGRVAAQLGTPVPAAAAHGLACRFPAAEVVAASDLAGVGLTRARVAAVRAFAAAVAGGEVPLDAACELDALVGALVALPGLGPWTAHYVALRLGHADAFPASDLGLRRAFAALGGSGDLAAHAVRWQPFRAFAAAHLWLSGAG